MVTDQIFRIWPLSDGVPFPANRKDPALTEAEALKGVTTVIDIGVTKVIDRDLLKTMSVNS